MRQDVLFLYMRINAKRNFYLHLEHFFSLNLNYAAYDKIIFLSFLLPLVTGEFLLVALLIVPKRLSNVIYYETVVSDV